MIAYLFAGTCAIGQTSLPFIGELKQFYTIRKGDLLKAADRMPAEDYEFKPTPQVRTFSQLLAHIIDAQMGFCSAAKGEPRKINAASKNSKADLVAALKESFATCDGVFDSLTDATAVEMVNGIIGSPPTPPGQTRTRLSTMWNVVRHSNELYGYMAVYLRLKGVVPPTSAPD